MLKYQLKFILLEQMFGAIQKWGGDSVIFPTAAGIKLCNW